MCTAAASRLLVILLVILCETANATIYVSTNGNDVSDGLTWATAKKTVQAGLNAASSGDQVWVAAGIYVECITLKNGVALYGGFAGGETDLSQRNWVTNVTILDGNKGGSVVTAPVGATTSTRIDGFTIRNGSGPGIRCVGSSPMIANSTISGNSWDGIYCDASSPTITNNTIVSNGDGIYCGSSSPTITNNTISGNSWDGIYCDASSPTITNNTISSNDGGIYCRSSSSTAITNSIIAFNSFGIYADGGTPDLSHNCVYGNAAYNFSNMADPTGANGNIALDPQLVTLAGGNVHLQPTSPCVDAGYNMVVQSGWTDIDGQARIQGLHVDIGADESDGTVWPPPPAIIYVSPSGNDSSNGLIWASAKRTVQAGINAAGTGAQVWVAASTYVENITLGFGVALYGGFAGGETDLSQRNWVTNMTILNGNKGGSVVTAVTAATVSTRIDGFTIRNGSGPGGGGIYCVGYSPTIANNTISGNSWAGIYCGSSSPTITNNTISGNSWVGVYCDAFSPTIANNTISSNNGGGIYCSSSSPTIANNTISGNSAGVYSYGGGGIYCEYDASPTITNNTITGNSAYDKGGGIYCDGSSPTIANNTITGNTATSTYRSVYGGGICCCGSSPSISNNTIAANTVASSDAFTSAYGGGIYCDTYSSPMIANNNITGNTATGGSTYGGGICSNHTWSSYPTIISNNSITGNSAAGADGHGGGVYCIGSHITISNSTIASNSAVDGGGLYLSSDSPMVTNTIIAFNSSGVYAPSSAVFRYNCVYGNGVYEFSGLGDCTGRNGNIRVDPKLADLAHANANCHIQPDSPCKDAGTDADVLLNWLDIDGQPRILGSHVDIGADESDGTTWTSAQDIIVRVSPAGDDANDGSSWTLAKRTVQTGINAASAKGGEVWVAGGTYYELVTLRPYAHLYGGFAGTETRRDQRDWGTNVTILDGSRSGIVVTAIAIAPGLSTLDGFTVCNGTPPASYREGGGIRCWASSPTIANNTISGNSAKSYGGGIDCYFASPAIVNNMITGNTAGSGGGICCDASSPTIANNTISGNSAGIGGGICCLGRFPAIISNNTISGNSANSYGRGRGGGIYCGSASHTITNNTITGNTTEWDGGGIYCDGSSPTIANTIIAFNSSGIYSYYETLRLSHNCVYGNVASNYFGLTDPTGTNGNISLDPQLAALAGGNLHLQPTSPCVDAGDDTVVQSGWTDMDGQARIQGFHVDIGADEADGTVWPPPPAIIYVSPGGDDSSNGLTWASAKRTVQAGISAAGAGTQVWVAAGTYVENITMGFGVALYGGFAGSETDLSQRNWTTNVTILDGNKGGNVVTAPVGATASTRIDGFTVRNGCRTSSGSASGYGIYCVGSALTISNNTISGNGAGIRCSSSPSTISNNTISGNKDTGISCSYGCAALISNNTISGNNDGGIRCEYSSPMISNNTITGNTAVYDGGSGICCDYGSSPTISNNTISGNTGAYGGGILCISPSTTTPTINNNTISGNTGGWGGGICCTRSSPTISNNTISGNAGGYSGGIYSDSSVAITNTIIAFNSSGVYVDNGTAILSHNCVYGNTGFNYYGLTDPTGTNGNLSVDPLFVRSPTVGADGKWATADDDPGDLRLATGSPCINGGDPAYVPAVGEVDMDGQPRKIGAGVDIGADEFWWQGDANYDGYVNVGDLQLLVQVWGTQKGDADYVADVDGNRDGFVNVADLQLLVGNWGKG